MAAAVVSIHTAKIIRGQRAWKKIKATAQEQRELWREVGEALLEGRELHPSNQAFGKWCNEAGFGDMDRHDKADAMWMVSNWPALCEAPTTIGHPSWLRRWFNDQPQQDAPVASAIRLDPTDKPRKRISIKTAKKALKLHGLAEQGIGGEKETARRHLHKFARDNNLDVEEFVELAKKTDPDFNRSANNTPALEHNLQIFAGATKALAEALRAAQAGETTPITREAIIALFDQACDALNVI